MSVDKVKEGRFLIGEDETSYRTVSEKVYNDPNKYQIILNANGGVNWKAGVYLRIPHKEGRIATPQESETTPELIARMFPNQPVHLYTDNFYKWNAGNEAEDLIGSQVFIPER